MEDQSSQLAVLFDKDGTTPITNPFLTSTDGGLRTVTVSPGVYEVTAVYKGLTKKVLVTVVPLFGGQTISSQAYGIGEAGVGPSPLSM